MVTFLERAKGKIFFKAAETPVQRKCEHCEEEEQGMQWKELNGEETSADSNLENYIVELIDSGQPLLNEVRNYYEPRFNYDFSIGKMHSDGFVSKSAQPINTLAYATGK